MFSNFKTMMGKVYESFLELENSGNLSSRDKELYHSVANKTLAEEEYPFTLKYLTELIYKHRNVRPLVLIENMIHRFKFLLIMTIMTMQFLFSGSFILLRLKAMIISIKRY